MNLLDQMIGAGHLVPTGVDGLKRPGLDMASWPG